MPLSKRLSLGHVNYAPLHPHAVAVTSAGRRQEIRVPVLASAPSPGSGDFPVCPPVLCETRGGASTTSVSPEVLGAGGRGLGAETALRPRSRPRNWPRSRPRFAQNSCVTGTAQASAAGSWSEPVASTLWPLCARPHPAEVNTGHLHVPWDAQVPLLHDQPAPGGHLDPGGQETPPNPGPILCV